MLKLPTPHAIAAPGQPVLLPASSANSVKNLGVDSRWGEGLLVSAPDAVGIHRAAWEFDCATGSYELWAEYISAEQRPVHIYLDRNLSVRRGLTRNSAAWTGIEPTWHYQATVALVAGTHSLTLDRNGYFPHVRSMALIPVAGGTEAPTSDERYRDSVDGRVEGYVPLSSEDAATAIHQVAPMIRVLLNQGCDAEDIVDLVANLVHATQKDIAHPQDRIGFGGPMNGQILRQTIFYRLNRIFRFDVFVETGTYHGTTTEMLARLGRPVLTSEISKDYYYRSAIRLSDFPNVRLVNDDSRSFLRNVQSTLSSFRSPFFYLDAHWGDDLPLPEEIEIIRSSTGRFVIMVDDFKHPKFDYGFDKYSNDVELSMEYVAPRLRHLDDLAFVFPTASDTAETGAKRGTLLIMPGEMYQEHLSDDPGLMRWQPP